MLVAIIILLPTIIALAIWDAHTYQTTFFENTYVDEFSDLYYDAEGVWYESTSEVYAATKKPTRIKFQER
jgi:hypothetical protein